MDIREFEEFVPSVLERMRADGYARTTMGTAKWVFGWFADYCHEVEVGDVDEAAVADFCAKRFGFAAGESKLLPTQAAIRKRIADRGFYSEGNMRLFSANGNSYIMPVPSNRRAFGDAMAEVWAKGFSRDFQWRGGRKHSRIQWRQTRPEGGDRVIVFRDVEENERCRSNYQRCIDLGRPGYTPEGLEEEKEVFGVYVLRTSSKLGAAEVLSAYKRRWGIETLCQCVANVGGFENLKVEDYYKEQGMAFVMLVCGRIHARVMAAVRSLGDSTTSVRDVLLMARRLKLVRRGGSWVLANSRKRDLETLKRLGFESVRRLDAV